jgi:RNA polymerase sigma factor (sigma-70 family)
MRRVSQKTLSDLLQTGCLIGEMQEQSDVELLRDYATNANEAAFRELVIRYTDLIYSAALRQVSSAVVAQEIAPSVFTDLARKARPLAASRPESSSLAGWLYRSTRFASLNQMRDGRRRVARERQAMEQLITNSQTGPDWERIQPALDEAMADLNDHDREALLLRYFRNHDFCNVGRALGISDDAAQKRVSRAVERLRDLLARRGITIGAGGLVALISANAVQAAPAGLAVTLSSAALLAGTTAASAAATSAMNWINIKSIAAIVTSAVVAGTATHVIEQNQTNRLREANQRLVAQAQSLTTEKNEALAAATGSQDELQRLRENQSELLRLRGEVAQSRTQQKEVATLRDENQRLRTVASSTQLKTSQIQNQATMENTRSNRLVCINQLRLIDGASQQCALEYHLTATNIVTAELILPYLKGNEIPRCPDGGDYAFGILTNLPTCSIPGHAIPTQN